MRDHVDICLAAAFQDVPVPEGLAARLLERLAAEAVSSGLDRRFSTRVAPRSPLGNAVYNRRWLLVGGGLLTVAAGLIVAVWLGAHGEQRLSEQSVFNDAIRSFNAGPEERGQLLAEKPAPAEYPLSRMMRKARAAKWRSVDGFLGCRGVVYDLPGPVGSHAALYVVERKVDGLGTSPALHPFTTAGCCASAWQEGRLLYVLVVQGDLKTYEGYLNLPRSPVA
jgi:hypothetical protein